MSEIRKFVIRVAVPLVLASILLKSLEPQTAYVIGALLMLVCVAVFVISMWWVSKQ